MRLRRAMALLPIVAVVTACSGGDDAAVSAPPPSPAPEARAGGELRVGVVRPATVDPTLVAPGDTAAHLIVRTMCDSLLSTDPVTRELRPAVASSFKVLSGGASVQFELRKGVRFNDGTPVKASDAVASLQRLMDPESAAPARQYLRTVVGWQDVEDGERDVSSVPGIKTVTDQTINVGLHAPDSHWVYGLSQPYAAPVPKDAARRPGFSQQPVCVGPYRLTQPYTGQEDQLVLERVKDYQGLRSTLTRSGQGWVDRIVFRIYADRHAALRALRAGQVDAAQVTAADAVAARDQGSQVLAVSTGRLEYIGLPRGEAFADPRVRAALSLALDRTPFELARGFEPAYSLFPPTLPDSALPQREIRQCGSSPKGDVQAAKALLTEAKFNAPSAPVNLLYNDEFGNAETVRLAAASWRAGLGLAFAPSSLPFEELMNRAASGTGINGAFRMAHAGLHQGIPAFVLPLVSRESGGESNLTRYEGQALQRRLERGLMEALTPEDQRNELLPVALALCGDPPVIPVGWYRSHLAVSSTVVVAGAEGVDRGAGLPELRELAVVR